jgi:hypothetical protein
MGAKQNYRTGPDNKGIKRGDTKMHRSPNAWKSRYLAIPHRIAILIFVCFCAAGALVLRAQAQGYQLPWYTMDSGGSVSQGSGYTLRGVAGQHDAETLRGSGFTLVGGFVQRIESSGLPTTERTLYMPSVRVDP